MRKLLNMLLFIPLLGTGQISRHYDDLIRLKDGSKCQGIIIENVQGDYVKVRAKSGEISVVSYDQVAEWGKRKVVDSVRWNRLRFEIGTDAQVVYERKSYAGTGLTGSVFYKLSDYAYLGAVSGAYFLKDRSGERLLNKTEALPNSFAVSVDTKHTTDYSYSFLGLALRTYLIPEKRFSHYVEISSSLARFFSDIHQKKYSRTMLTCYQYFEESWFIGSMLYTTYYYSELNSTIRYSRNAQRFSIAYGIDKQINRKLKLNYSIGYSALVTSYNLIRDEKEIWFGEGLPPEYVFSMPYKSLHYSVTKYSDCLSIFSLKAALCF